MQLAVYPEHGRYPTEGHKAYPHAMEQVVPYPADHQVPGPRSSNYQPPRGMSSEAVSLMACTADAMEFTANIKVVVPAELPFQVPKPTLDDDDDTALNCFRDVIVTNWKGGVDDHDCNKSPRKEGSDRAQ